MRSSDAAGRPGRAAETHVARQPVFSQSLGQVNKQLKKRQVSSQMPVHNSFLDECHEGGKKESGPIRLTWGSSNKTQRSIAQRMFAHRGRLQLTRGGQGGGGDVRSLRSSRGKLGGREDGRHAAADAAELFFDLGVTEERRA